MNAKWNINVEGVSEVLTKTSTAAEPFNALTKTYGDNLNNLTVALKWDIFTVVAVAISEYGQHWNPTLQAAGNQVNASLLGASNAVKAYMAGQEEMAANAQRLAANGYVPPEPGSEPAPSSGRNRAV